MIIPWRNRLGGWLILRWGTELARCFVTGETVRPIETLVSYKQVAVTLVVVSQVISVH